MTGLLNAAPYEGLDVARWDDAVERVGPDVIPLSVADMDFAAPREVVDAVVGRARAGAYRYTQVPERLPRVVARWFEDRHGWRIDPGHVVPVGRVVEAMPALLRELTAPGAGVLVHTPAYAPVTGAIEANGRTLVRVPLLDGEDGQVGIDLAATERALRADASVLLLTNPHNPTGRAWTVDELTALADIATRTGALVISDDVHADLVLPGRRYVPFASLDSPAAARAITFTSPGKSFNMAGLESAHVIVADDEMRARVVQAFDRAGFHNPRYFAVAATEAAYTHGGPWLDELRHLLARHVEILREHLAASMPGVRLVVPEATHLAWLDLRAWSSDEAALVDLVERRARVQLTFGSAFGAPVEGFARINLAVPTPVLREALGRLARVYADSCRPEKAVGVLPAAQRKERDDA